MAPAPAPGAAAAVVVVIYLAPPWYLNFACYFEVTFVGWTILMMNYYCCCSLLSSVVYEGLFRCCLLSLGLINLTNPLVVLCSRLITNKLVMLQINNFGAIFNKLTPILLLKLSSSTSLL